MVKKLIGRKTLCALLSLCLSACSQTADSAKYFTKNAAERALETAINNDDAQGIVAAIAQGADVNTVGKAELTPLLLSVGRLKVNASRELLKNGADPQARNMTQDNPMTVAVDAYYKVPELLEMLLEYGGDPSSLQPNDNPVIMRFLTDYKFDAARFLASKGADINARTRTEEPLVVSYALSGDWDAVWVLLELGADYDYADEQLNIEGLLNDPDRHAPGSPLWPYKVKVWKFLKEKGVAVAPQLESIIKEKYWQRLAEKGLPKPDLEAEFKAWSEKNPD
ncbi:MAG: hypothetical protein HRU06_04940 [Oceanospirillaceae bacterium]|nr:hypothetical protein [Oceanospirillaceae bacterium]